MDDYFDPKKYGMLFCLKCNGNRKLLVDPDNIQICQKCGGFGFVKKEDEQDEKKDSGTILNNKG